MIFFLFVKSIPEINFKTKNFCFSCKLWIGFHSAHIKNKFLIMFQENRLETNPILYET